MASFPKLKYNLKKRDFAALQKSSSGLKRCRVCNIRPVRQEGQLNCHPCYAAYRRESRAKGRDTWTNKCGPVDRYLAYLRSKSRERVEIKEMPELLPMTYEEFIASETLKIEEERRARVKLVPLV